MKKIILYGPSDKNIPQHRIGGAEVGTNRTIELLKNNGFEVVLINKPTLYYGKFRVIIDYLKAKKQIRKLLKTGNNIFYCIGFYYKNASIEKRFIEIAKKYNNKVIYEPKNGSLITSLKDGDDKYKNVMNNIFINSDYIFCQGKIYKDYLNEKYSSKAIYIPNFIKKEMIVNDKKFIDSSLDLVFWGRITQSKNIELIIDIFNLVSEMIDKKVTLTLIGSVDEEYLKVINERISQSKYSKNVSLLERKKLLEIKEIVKDKHFYLFPSIEKNEGHSNALTEAMAFGLVPIASDFGFNADIIGNNDLIIKQLDAKIYAKTIVDIYNNNKFYNYSEEMINKVRDNYIEEIIDKRIIDSINSL